MSVNTPSSTPAVRRRRLTRGLRAAGALAVVLGLVAACGGTGTSGPVEAGAGRAPAPVEGDRLAPHPLPERTVVTAAVSGRIASYGALLLADELGEFEKENIELQLEPMPAQDSLLLMSQGSLDVVGASFSAGMLNLTASGADLRSVFPAGGRVEDTRQGIWVNTQAFGDDGAFQPDDLRGATVGTLGGANSLINANLFRWLTDQGGTVTPAETDMQNLTSSDAVAALRSGAVDAGNASAPFHEILVDDPCCEFLPGAFPLVPLAQYVFGANLLEERPEVGAAVVRVLARTVRNHLQGDYLADPEVLAAFAKATDTPEQELLGFERSVFDPTFEMPTEQLDIAQDYFRQLDGALQYDEPLTVDQVYDLSFVEAALPESP